MSLLDFPPEASCAANLPCALVDLQRLKLSSEGATSSVTSLTDPFQVRDTLNFMGNCAGRTAESTGVSSIYCLIAVFRYFTVFAILLAAGGFLGGPRLSRRAFGSAGVQLAGHTSSPVRLGASGARILQLSGASARATQHRRLRLAQRRGGASAAA